MRWIKTVFDFYIDASIHVALSVTSLFLLTTWFLERPPNYNLLIFICLSTIVCYNFIKYGVEAEKYLIVSNTYHKVIQVFSFLCFFPMAYCMRHLDSRIWLTIAVLTLLSGIYALPVLPQAKNLRSLGIYKIFIVALVWTGFTVALPVVDSKVLVSWDVYVTAVQRFLLVLLLILPFEVRDMTYDRAQMKTVPQRLGVHKTKILGYGLVLCFFVLTFLKDAIDQVEIWTRLFVSLAIVLILGLTSKNQRNYFASFWVESVPIFWLLMLWMLEKELKL